MIQQINEKTVNKSFGFSDTVSDAGVVEISLLSASRANKVLAFTGAEWSPLDLDTIITDINLTTATIGTANLTDLSVDFGTIPD